MTMMMMMMILHVPYKWAGLHPTLTRNNSGEAPTGALWELFSDVCTNGPVKSLSGMSLSLML
eukprot:9133190-Karenia_brevis.AAC.1